MPAFIIQYGMKYIAPILAVLTVVGVIYGKGRIDESHKNEVAILEQSLAATQKSLALEKRVRIADGYKAMAASQRLGQLNTKAKNLEAYVEKLENADRVCLSKPDVDQLRNLWK